MKNKEFIFVTIVLVIISVVFGTVVHRILSVDIFELPNNVDVNPFVVLAIFIPSGILIACIINWRRIKELYLENP